MVGEIFVGILTVVFMVALWCATGAGPAIAGFVLYDWLHDERRYNRSRVAQYSWLIKTAYWIAIVLYYALYLAIFFASYGPPPAMQ